MCACGWVCAYNVRVGRHYRVVRHGTGPRCCSSELADQASQLEDFFFCLLHIDHLSPVLLLPFRVLRKLTKFYYYYK